MARIDMSEFMSQQPGQGRFISQFEQDAPSYRDASPGEGIGIHVNGIYGLESVRHPRTMGMRDKALADLTDVPIQCRILNDTVVR